MQAVRIVENLRGFFNNQIIGAAIVNNQLNANLAVENGFIPAERTHYVLAVLIDNGADDNIGVEFFGKRLHGVTEL